ncbi:DUF3298 domain-containing protein [Kurthia sibirica]|uniref:Anti-sigma factor n=1 Tax=Kurthia sibirica TaxID=202750 RepID=A0A2U3AR15_9BACL|nr:DUF3298 domain-containing protein [Kurthia sibirica]PWI26964.1 anti-sigma factor [Kurthia sibirica]GEK32489.1 anti-sigma-V factor RsiV [Kurthia sibirica]
MTNDKLKELKKEYENRVIPPQLDSIVETALHKGRKKKNHFPKWLIGFAAAILLFTTALNMNPAMAKTLSAIPVLGHVIQVLTWTEYTVDEPNYNASIKVPAIEDLKDKKLQQRLNEQYQAEGKKLFEDFKKEVGDIKKLGGGHFGIDSGYEIKTNNSDLLAIGRYAVNTAASSSTVMHYDTIDKKKEILLTLPMLFKNDDYITIITANIKEQMLASMAAPNSDKTYWIKDGTAKDDELTAEFNTIKKNNKFYINNEGKLIISFDKYDVAPGYMGIVEFEIPTKILKNLLLNNDYIH